MRKVARLLVPLTLLLVVMVVAGCGSKFALTALEVSPEVCLTGDTVTVSAAVTYSGDTAADYEAELKVDGAVAQTQTFSFEPGESRLLPFTLSQSEPGICTVELGGLKASFAVLKASNMRVSPSEVEVDQPVTVTADLQNTAGDEVVYSCRLFCQGAEVQSKGITMAADSTSQVSFTLSQASPGYYQLELMGLSGSFKVLKPAEFIVYSLDVSPNPVKVGEAATITAGVENVGEVAGSYELNLTVDGVVEETREITLAGGTNATESLSLCKDAEGSYSLQLGDQQLELRVVQPVQLPTGTIILSEMSSGKSHLEVNNNEDADVVVVLAASDEPETPLWAAYIRADDSYTYRRIARGTYIFYYVFGEDWDDEAKEFLTVRGYNQFADEFEFKEAAYTYTIWTVTFGAEIGGGSSSLTLDEDEFPSLE
jgi:hypothetical protein